MKFWYNPSFLALLALFMLSIFALKDLAKAGFYTSHDGETHTARIAAYYSALKDGQIPPRFAGTFYNGLGSPIFVYIYPSPYFFGSIIHQVGFSFASSFKLLMAIGFILSGTFCFLWLKEILKSSKAALLGALFYIWSPYRFLLIYVRGSISENTAYVFLPLVLFCLTKLNDKKNFFWFSISAISFALLLLSQNLVAFLSTPLIFIYSIVLVLGNKTWKKSLFSQLASLFLGFLMSAFTYLPAFFERKFVKFDEIIGSAYASHFVTLKQLIYSPWDYGFDLPGTVNDSLSLQLGLAHWLILVLLIVFALFKLASKLRTIKKINNYLFIATTKFQKMLLILFLSTLAVSLFLMVQSSPNSFIWREFKTLEIIDIPWRLLGISGISIAFLAAFLIKTTKNGLIFLVLIIAVLVANRNHIRVNKNIIYEDQHFVKYYGHATYYSEFTPIWRGYAAVPHKINPLDKYKIINGSVSAISLETSSNKLLLQFDVKSDNARIRLNRSYFPDMSITDNGTELENFSQVLIQKSSDLVEGDDVDNVGLPIINLTKGTHQVKMVFTETPLRNLADVLSLASFFLALIFLVKFRNVKVY